MSDYSIMSERIAQRNKAVASEKRMFGYSVLSEIDRDMRRAARSVGSDVYVSNDGANDGHISFSDKMVNFGKGLVAPIKSMFSSPVNMAIGALSVVGGAALIAATGGAAAPVMVAVGLLGGGFQIAKGLYNQANAVTDEQAANAWKDMGTGTFTVGASALGAKSALKTAGTDVSGMSRWKAAGKCISDAPKYFKTCANKFSTIFPSAAAGSKAKTSSPKLLEAKVADDGVVCSDVPSTKTPKTANPSSKPETIVEPKHGEIIDGVIHLGPPEETVISESSAPTITDIDAGFAETQAVEIKSPSLKSDTIKPKSNTIEVIKPNGEKVVVDMTPPSQREILQNKFKKILDTAQEQVPQKKTFSTKLKDTLGIFGFFKPKKN